MKTRHRHLMRVNRNKLQKVRHAEQVRYLKLPCTGDILVREVRIDRRREPLLRWLHIQAVDSDSRTVQATTYFTPAHAPRTLATFRGLFDGKQVIADLDQLEDWDRIDRTPSGARQEVY